MGLGVVAYPPPWLTTMPTPPGSALAFPGLDSGEQGVRALADLVHADLLLMDDRGGFATALLGRLSSEALSATENYHDDRAISPGQGNRAAGVRF